MDKKKLEKLCQEAMLEFSDEDLDKLSNLLDLELEKAWEIASLALEDTEGLDNLTDNSICLREDVAGEGLDREDALSYARDKHYGYFEIKRVID